MSNINQEWQPIDNCPKDGTVIEIMNCNGKIFIGFCVPETEENNQMFEEIDSLNVYYKPTYWRYIK